MLSNYIDSLTQNVVKEKLPSRINIVFDIGAFNGGFGAGVALYVKALENKGLTSIGKVSGCSIGAFLAIWFYLGCGEEHLKYTQKIYDSYRKKCNLAAYIKNIPEFVNSAFKNDDLSALHGKVYLTYYDTKRNKRRVVTKFRHRRHLIDCMLRSSHVPYLSNGKSKWKGRYIDGMVPYMFTDTTIPSLFVNLMTLCKITKALRIKNEQNVHYRILVGITDAHDFFVFGSSDMCSYINRWNLAKKCYIHFRLYLFLCVIHFMDCMMALKCNLPTSILGSSWFLDMTNLFKILCNHLVNKILV